MSTPPVGDQVTDSYQLSVNGRDREVSDAWIGESLMRCAPRAPRPARLQERPRRWRMRPAR